MNGDQGRVRLDNGPHDLAVLRHMALNVTQRDITNCAQAGMAATARGSWHYRKMR
jgi:hypothetical protein